MVGTEEYIAPETIEDTNSTYASDLWSLGVILFQMLEGKTPFMGKSPTETFRNIVELKGIEFKLCNDEQARDLVTRLLRLVPEERIGAINF
jgi:3-phosphoinositide dependent protein kinase-1